MMSGIMDALGGAYDSAKEYVTGNTQSEAADKDKASKQAQIDELMKDREAVASGPYENEELRKQDLASIDAKIAKLKQGESGSGGFGDDPEAARYASSAQSAANSAKSGVSIQSAPSVSSGQFDANALLSGASMNSLQGVLQSPASRQIDLLNKQNQQKGLGSGFRM